MPKAHRKGDIGSGHGKHGPTTATGGSNNVFINGKPAMRVGDEHTPYPHVPKLAEGSSSVFINGIPASRVGDAFYCGGKAQTGSSNVFIGDKGPKSEPTQQESCHVSGANGSSTFSKG